MATVTRRRNKDGVTFWQATWFITVDGKRKQRNRSFARKADAAAFSQQMADEVERRGIHAPKAFTVRAYLRHWIDNHPKQLSPTTLAGYRRHCDMACRHIGDVPLAKLGAVDLDRMYRDLLARGGVTQRKNPDGTRNIRRLDARTVHHVHAVLRTALRQAVKWRLIPDAPTALATPPQPGKSPARAMTKAERQRVLDAARKAIWPGLDVVISLLGIGGLRRSELLGLAWDDINFDRGELVVQRTVVSDGGQPVIREKTKTQSSRRLVTVPPGLLALLQRHRAFTLEQALAFGRDYFRSPMLCFPDVGGFPMRPDALTSKLRSLMRTAHVSGVQPVHGHRHSMATHMLAEGIDIKTISARLGHSSVAITHDLYVHALDERAKEAGEKLEKAFGGE